MKRTSVRVVDDVDTQPLSRVETIEVLPCPDCGTKAVPPRITEGVETVRCEQCGRLLRHRPALTPEQRAEAKILRVAARELENEWGNGLHARRRIGWPWQDSYSYGILLAAKLLRQWARTVHKRPPQPERRRAPRGGDGRRTRR